MMKLADHGFFVVEPDKSRHTLRESLTDAFQLSQVEIDCADVCLIGNEVSGQCHQLLGRVFSITENLVAMLAQQSSHSARLVVVIDIKKSEGIVSAFDPADAATVLSDQNLVVFLLCNTIFALQVPVPLSFWGRLVRPLPPSVLLIPTTLSGALTVFACGVQAMLVGRYAVELIGRFSDLALAATFFGYVDRISSPSFVATILTCVLEPAFMAIVWAETADRLSDSASFTMFFGEPRVNAVDLLLLVVAGLAYSSASTFAGSGLRELIERLSLFALVATLFERSIIHVGFLVSSATPPACSRKRGGLLLSAHILPVSTGRLRVSKL
jgi:hypothetical protein